MTASRKLRSFNGSSPLTVFFECEHTASTKSQHHNADHHGAFQAGQIHRFLPGVRGLRAVRGACAVLLLRIAGAVFLIAAGGLGLLRSFLTAEDGGVSDHTAASLGHLAGVAGADRVAGGVLAGGGAGVAGGGGVAGDGIALSVNLRGFAPLHIPQGQGLAVVRNALGNEGDIRLRQIGIAAAGGEGIGFGGVAVRGDLDAGVVQTQDADIAVLGGHLHLSVQPLEDGFQVVGIAGLGDGFGVGLDVHPNLVLPGHVQQVIAPAISHEVLRGDEAGIVRQGQLIDLVDPQLVKVAIGVLLHGYGVVAGSLARIGSIGGQGGGTPGHDNDNEGAQGGENAFHGIIPPFFRLF